MTVTEMVTVCRSNGQHAVPVLSALPLVSIELNRNMFG
jgi:hypothetical protein